MSETATTPKRRKKVEKTAEPVSRQEVVVHLPLSELHPMPDAPYGVRDDEAMRSTDRSIKENGVLSPAIVRPRADGGYEIIAGNRRKHGAELADLATMPCIVRNLDDNEAIIQMVDSNFQREDVLPSERAKAYTASPEAQFLHLPAPRCWSHRTPDHSSKADPGTFWQRDAFSRSSPHSAPRENPPAHSCSRRPTAAWRFSKYLDYSAWYYPLINFRIVFSSAVGFRRRICSRIFS